VREAHLCGLDRDGNDYSHRRGWIREKLTTLSDIYAVDIISYDITSRDLCIVAQFRPDQVQRWDDLEVARRSLKLMPAATFPEARRVKARLGETVSQKKLIAALAKEEQWVEQQRQRLRSPSWFMKDLKEPIARSANAEDSTRGAFWEGRFKCIALLDPAAVLACCVYVDLDQVRLGLADSPEHCTFTSIADRLLARQGSVNGRAGPEDGLWLRRLELPPGADGDAVDLGVSAHEYLQLVLETGRRMRSQPAGRIDSSLDPILERLKLNPKRWVAVMSQEQRFRGTGVGCAAARREEAKRRQTSWVVGRSGVHLN
jgi:hypothetical protein